jgi:hypothetical protein
VGQESGDRGDGTDREAGFHGWRGYETNWRIEEKGCFSGYKTRGSAGGGARLAGCIVANKQNQSIFSQQITKSNITFKSLLCI